MTPAERHMRADARRNYALLLAAARDAFTEHGPEATLDDIAKRAVLGPGTLYRHFPNREALLAAVYIGDVEALAAQADELSQTHQPWEALAAWMSLLADYSKHKRGGLGVAVKSMLGADSDTLAACRDMLRGALGRLVEQAQQAGVVRPDVNVMDVLKLVHAVGIASESAPEHADRLLSLVLDGLRPQQR